MSVPVIAPHTFIPRAHTHGRTCDVCGGPDGNSLHPQPPVTDPDTVTTPAGDWQPYDIVIGDSQEPFQAVPTRYDGLRFVPLLPVADGQGTPPRGARLLHRRQP